MAKITVEFEDDSSSVATFRIESANYMQLLAAADVLRMEGEGAYMQARMMGAGGGKGLIIPKLGGKRT